MPSESQTTAPPSTRHGTLPLGENARNFVQLEPGSNATTCSANVMPSSCISTHGRSDQDE